MLCTATFLALLKFFQTLFVPQQRSAMKNSEHYGWSWKAVILFLLSHVVRSQCTTVRVEHSVLSIPLAHVGTAVEQAAVAELLTSHQHRVTRSSRLNSFIQRRRTLRVRSQGSLSGKLPLQNQCKARQDTHTDGKSNNFCLCLLFYSDLPKRRISTVRCKHPTKCSNVTLCMFYNGRTW